MVARDSSHACDLCMYDVASGVNFCGKIFAIGELRYVLLSRVGFASCRELSLDSFGLVKSLKCFTLVNFLTV